ncbi:MAG: homocysteine S-methyltransferase family protein [Oscillospiraceae bacterium]|nr:homocysteine S-methyltransferase family protein [Oscillospiraceae bacterium]
MLFEDKKFVIYDGAMGTMLQKSGLKPGERSDLMNIHCPDAVENVHRLYVEAGSDIIGTNTFGANAMNLEGTGYTPEEIISAAVAIAKRASNGRAKISLDMGPTGKLLAPMGDLEVEKAYALFKQQAIAGAQAEVDYVSIETMSDLEEMKAAILAVREHTDLGVLATMTFTKSGCTFMGCTPEDFARTAQDMGVLAVGLNCSLEPQEMFETAQKMAAATTLPLIIKPNAGLPVSEVGSYDTGPDEFVQQMLPFAEIGAKLIGGCCGTTPEYISKLKKAFECL